MNNCGRQCYWVSQHSFSLLPCRLNLSFLCWGRGWCLQMETFTRALFLLAKHVMGFWPVRYKLRVLEKLLLSWYNATLIVFHFCFLPASCLESKCDTQREDEKHKEKGLHTYTLLQLIHLSGSTKWWPPPWPGSLHKSKLKSVCIYRKHLTVRET